jgi:hypothetical protein
MVVPAYKSCYYVTIVVYCQQGLYAGPNVVGLCCPAGISKALETSYTRVLATQLQDKGIMVNACCPGYALTCSACCISISYGTVASFDVWLLSVNSFMHHLCLLAVKGCTTMLNVAALVCLSCVVLKVLCDRYVQFSRNAVCSGWRGHTCVVSAHSTRGL